MANRNRSGLWSCCIALFASASLSGAALAQDGGAGKDLPDSVLKLEEQLVAVVRKVSPTFVVIGGGSGVVISPDGWMLTNHHVAGDRPVGADWTVKLPSGKIYEARLVGTDPTGDISLLKIAVKDGETLPYVEFGDSDSCRVGQWVVALGNPFGFAKDSKPTVTYGLISAFHRYRGNYGDAIQTDAPINSGNSGGPLLDIDGRLIGINGSITTRHGVKINSGAGYAISIAQIKRFLPVLKAGGVVSHGRIEGLNVGNTDKGSDGARINSVRGDAASAGLREGDVIVEVGGLPIPNAMRFMGAVSTFPGGTELELKVRRGRETIAARVKLSSITPRSPAGVRPQRPTRGASLGANMRDSDSGIQVTRVVEGSAAAKAGLKVDDIVEALDGQSVTKLADLRSLMRGKGAGDKLSFRVKRGTETLTIEVTLG